MFVRSIHVHTPPGFQRSWFDAFAALLRRLPNLETVVITDSHAQKQLMRPLAGARLDTVKTLNIEMSRYELLKYFPNTEHLKLTNFDVPTDSKDFNLAIVRACRLRRLQRVDFNMYITTQDRDQFFQSESAGRQQLGDFLLTMIQLCASICLVWSLWICFTG